MTPAKPAPTKGRTIKVERLELDNIDNAAVYEVSGSGSSLAFTVNLFLAVPGENEALAAEIVKRYNVHEENARKLDAMALEGIKCAALLHGERKINARLVAALELAVPYLRTAAQNASDAGLHNYARDIRQIIADARALLATVRGQP